MLTSRPRLFQSMLQAFICALLLFVPLVWAQSDSAAAVNTGVRAISTPANIQISKLAVLRDASERWILADVIAGRAGAFTVIEKTLDGDDVITSRAFDSVTWVRLSFVPSTLENPSKNHQDHVLELPKHYIDQMRLFTQKSSSVSGVQWQKQEAGDALPRSRWAMPGPTPMFILPQSNPNDSQAQGEQVAYLQILHNAPFELPLSVLTVQQAAEKTQYFVLFSGLAFGAMLLSFMMVACLSWLYRDRLYVWYCAYSFFAALACVSHSGVGQWLLWPMGGVWPNFSTQVFVLLATATQLQFARSAFAQNLGAKVTSQLSYALSLICCAVTLAFVALPEHWFYLHHATLALPMLGMVLVLFWVARAIAAQNLLAKAWVLAFVPLLFTVSYSLLESMAWAGNLAMPYQLPILAASLEVILLGLSLQWLARERHGQKERYRALASTDPLTGFASEQSFRRRLQSAWNRPPEQVFDTAVAYIELRNPVNDTLQHERLLMRSVRVLRAATRSQDTVARLGGNTLAVLMPNMGMGEDLSQRLSRIIALGLMPDSGEAHTSVLQFRIAYTTRRHYACDLQQLDTDLGALLNERARWGHRPIRVIDDKRSATSRPHEIIASSELDGIWERALQQERIDTQAPEKPLPT